MKKTIELLNCWVNQRPGLDFSNYGDHKAYRSELRSITADRSAYYELLAMAHVFVDDLEGKLTKYLTENSGRLTLKDGALQYTTGQYWSTEYRPAACNAIKSLIWNALRDEKDSEGNDIYPTGDAIRKVFKNRLSRKTYKDYIG